MKKNPLIEIKHESGRSSYVRADCVQSVDTKDKKIDLVSGASYNHVTNCKEVVDAINALENEPT